MSHVRLLEINLISMWAFIVLFISVTVADVVKGDVEERTVMEGGDLTLHTGAQLDRDSEATWLFIKRHLNARIAQINRENVSTSFEERFKGRLHLDRESGSLTVRNISAGDAGRYEVSLIVRFVISERKFSVNVYAPVSVPAIQRHSVVIDQSPGDLKQTGDEVCVVFCSVRNDRDVFLSWYKGNEIMNQTSSRDLSINLSLSLELHCNDPETFICTAENPVSNKSVRLHRNEISQQCEGCLDHCGDTESLIRLVLSVLVGIATVFFLVDHVRICSSQRRDSLV